MVQMVPLNKRSKKRRKSTTPNSAAPGMGVVQSHVLCSVGRYMTEIE